MGKMVHKIISADESTKTGTCINCGTVRLKRRGKDGWRCYISQLKWTGRAYQAKYKKYKEKVCSKCGFVPEHHSQLDVDHIDNNHANNDPTNLQTLCANCHRLKTWKEHKLPH